MIVDLGIIFDGIVSILLIVTIAYAVVLNKKLGAIKKDRSELEALAKHFTDATERAEKSTRLLKKSTEESSQALDEQINQAHILKSELDDLVAKANRTIDNVKNNVVNKKGPIKSKFEFDNSIESKLNLQASSFAPNVDTAQFLAEDDEDDDDISPERGFKGLQALLRKEERESKHHSSFKEEKKSDAEEELLKALKSVK